MKLFKLLLATIILIGLSSNLYAAAHGSKTMAPQGAMAYIISPQDGAVVGETFTVKFGLKGMGVAPAGVDKAKTGHHHLLVDVDQLPDLSQPLGKDVKHYL